MTFVYKLHGKLRKMLGKLKIYLLQIIKFEIEVREVSEATKSSEKPGFFMNSQKREEFTP